MIAVDHPQPTPKKLSLFRHFSRGLSDNHLTTEQNSETYNAVVRPTTRIRTRSRQTPDITPPQSPASSDSSGASQSLISCKNDSVLDLRPAASHHRNKSGSSIEQGSLKVTHFDQVPRLTKDKSPRKHLPNTLVDRFKVTLPVPNSPSRQSSGSSTFSRPRTRALPTSLPNRSFVSEPRIAPWTLYLPPPQVHSLYMGFLPRSMDDRWFIYSEGPDAMGKLKVHFHRSWTKMKVAELFVIIDVKGEGAGKIVGLKWDEKSSGDGSRMSSSEAKHLLRTTAWCVLGVELEPEH